MDSKLTTEFTYSQIDEKLPDIAIVDLESKGKTTLDLSLTGGYHLYQYDINLAMDTEDNSLDLEEATINGLIGKSIFEIGKRDWTWGEGFSYNPTYPLVSDKAYLGSELSWMVDYSTFKLGATLDSNNTNLYSSWIIFNSLLDTSDYSFILSYLKDNSELEQLYSEEKKDGINLGVNYSKDFLNGLTAHGGYNIRYWDSTGEKADHYLLGGKYITADKVITLEYYHQEDDYLVCVLGNQSESFNNWSWEMKEVLNLNDYGERRSFDLSYIGKDNIIPSLEITNFSGPDFSEIKQNPQDWVVTFMVTIDLL